MKEQNEHKKPVAMLWRDGKVTKHNLTEAQKRAFQKLYQTYQYIELKEDGNNEI